MTWLQRNESFTEWDAHPRRKGFLKHDDMMSISGLWMVNIYQDTTCSYKICWSRRLYRNTCIYMCIHISNFSRTCKGAHIGIYIYTYTYTHSINIYKYTVQYMSHICLSTVLALACLFVYLSVYLFIHLSVCLLVYLSICGITYLSICLPDYLSTCLSVYLYLHLSLSVKLSIYVYMHLSVYLIIYLYI